jgi:hypothetical protein
MRRFIRVTPALSGGFRVLLLSMPALWATAIFRWSEHKSHKEWPDLGLLSHALEAAFISLLRISAPRTGVAGSDNRGLIDTALTSTTVSGFRPFS